MLLAEDLLLLLTDDVTGKNVVETSKLDLALAGAAVLDLAERERVDVAGPGESVREGRLAVRDRSATGEEVLDEALEKIADRGPRKPAVVLPQIAKGLRQSLYQRLADRGIVRSEKGRILGILPTHHWPVVDSAHEDEVRRGLHDVLAVGRAPSEREALLVSLLQAVDQVHKVVAGPGVDKRQVRARGKAIAEGEFAGEAVRKTVHAVNAAVVAAVTAAVVAPGSG